MVTADNIGRINVWPTYDVARDADTAECKYVGRLTVWRTNAEARANLSHEEEGGAPDWVPANAVIHIDFLGGTPQGRAWVQGTGDVAINTLLGADPNTSEGWGTTSYDPTDIVADGYLCRDNPAALLGAALTQILEGATIVVKVKQIITTDTITVALLSADGNDALEVALYYSTGELNALSWDGPAELSLLGIGNDANGALNHVAATITATRLECAANGSVALSAVLVDADRPAANPLVAALVDSGHKAIQSITLYDPLPSTDGLSELSEV